MNKKEQFSELLTRGVTEIIVQEHLGKLLASGKKLRIKFGIDPTGNLLHLGHAVALLKLRDFQKLGHTIIFLIGDHTAEIGDPSGRSKERVPLSKDQIKANMVSYQEQAGRILDMTKVEVRHNSQWYDHLTIMEFAELTSYVTVTQVLQRADFKKRLSAGEDISVREAFYPILQGYDSVKLQADIELGGSDQKFNLLMGRQIQKRYRQPEQDVVMVDLLEGLDGVEKMSKSSNNYIALTENPDAMYGKIMSIPDTMVGRYFKLATRVPMNTVLEIETAIKNSTMNPRDAKMHLAREIVALYYDAKTSEHAEREFIALFQKKEIPEDIPILRVEKKGWNIVNLLVESKLAASKGEARRLIEQGGVVIVSEGIEHEEKIQNDPKNIIKSTDIERGFILKRGKRHFVKIIA